MSCLIHTHCLITCRGLDNAGKTTILKRINGEPIDTISPTLGFNIKTLEHGPYKLNIWDVGGQKSIRSYWRNYFEQTDALVWVVDSADRLRIEDCRQELAQLLQEEVNMVTWENDPVIALHFSLSSFHQRLAGATLLVFANKQDIPSALTDVQLKEVSSFNRDCIRSTLVILT